MKPRLLLLILTSALALAGHAAITNITPITELNSTGEADILTGVSRNELFLAYSRLINSPISAESYLTSRTTTLNTFNSPGTGAFSLILEDLETFGGVYLSDNGLRLYYAVDKGLGSNADIYFTERLSTAEPFPAGTALTAINSNAYESIPRLTNDELRIVFQSDRNSALEVFEAIRPNTASAFSAPTQLSEIPNTFYFRDISSDGLTIFLGDTSFYYFYAATRPNLASPFGTPFQIYSTNFAANLGAAYVNGDSSRIYFNQYTGFQLETFELYSGDLDLTPPPTPSPTATPTPSPTPFDTSTLVPINMPVTPVMITGVAQADVLLTGGSFDSQGRYCFFNQRRALGGGNFAGESQLLRATPNGLNPAAVEVIATQAQLAAVDANWSATSSYNLGLSVDTLSDNSIILLSDSASATKVWRIIPGASPTITMLGSMSPIFTANYPIIAVDRGQSPNMIYIAIDNDIYSIPATGGDITLWKENAVNYSIMDMAIDINGDVIAIDTYLGFNRIDKDTQAITTIWIYEDLDWYSGQALAIHPVTGDLFCIYLIEAALSYPPSTRVFNVLKMERTGAESFADPTLFLYGAHILEDPDVLPWAEPNDEIIAPWGSLSFEPGGQSLWFCNGFFNNVMHYGTLTGTQGIISFWSVQATSANPTLWTQFK